MEENKSICNDSLFKVFFEEKLQPLFHFLLYKYGNEKEAQDVAQESFVKLWQNCHKVPFEKASAYLYRVANNLSIDKKRAEKTALNYRKESLDITYQSPEYLMEEQEYKAKVLKAINNLTDAQRTAFLLNRIDGKKYKEIAIMLDISVKAVEKRIHNALVSLKKELGNLKI